jgi:flagellin
VISEQFRAQIAGLNRAIQNSEGSINMIQTAEGSLNEINSLLVSMRELAIHAANEGFNDANQLAADQAEIENAIKTIDRIAANTQFGTKKLLDGTKDNIATITTANSSGLTIVQSGLTSGSHSVTATKTADASATLNTTSLGISLDSTGNPNNLEEKIHNLNVLQASAGAEKDSNDISITDAFGNGLQIDSTADYATILSAASTVAAATTSQAGTYTVVLNYQENNESVTGDQTLQVAIASSDTRANIVDKWNQAIANNSALAGKIEATTYAVGGGGTGVEFRSVNKGAQYSLKMTSASTTATDNYMAMGSSRSSRGVSLDILNFTVTTAKNTNTTANATVASATYSSMSTLATAIETALASAFGTVSDGSGASTTNDIDVEANGNKLRFFSYDEGSDYKIKHNSTGNETERLYNVLGLTADTLAISGTDALVSFDGYTSTITSVKYGSTSDVTVYNKAEGEAGRGSIDLVVDKASNGVNIGNLLLDAKAAKYDVRLDGGPASSVSAGKDATIYNADRSQSLKVRYDLTSQGGSETISNTDQSLVFQIGANVGQTAAIGLRNMSASALGKNLAGNMFASLADINVETVAAAQDSQAIIDDAINQVTNARGTLGSFQKNTLESNLRNLEVASQNLTASESGIRDTDMAQTMSEFTKYQILMQAGTAMLAQGNQMPQIVLSLFK